jgi:hypothetical protein
MPYLKPNNRDEFIDKLMKLEPLTSGELNFCITVLVHQWCKRKGINYATLNEADGVLGCVQKEFYRRFVAVYEDKKIKENGDVNFME